MLSFFRSMAKSKIFLIFLGIPLVAGLMVFGNVGDLVGGITATDAVVRAPGRTIDSKEFRRIFDAAKAQAEQRSGQTLTTEAAVAQGAIDGLLQSLAMREGLAAALTRSGLRPSDKLTAQALRRYEAFFNPVTGQFDKAAFLGSLQREGLSEEVFMAQLKDDVAFSHYQAGLASALRAPQAYSALAAASQLEQRTFSGFFIDPRSVPLPPPPTDDQLRAFIKENAAQLTLPEMRNLTVVRFSARQLAPSITVDPVEVQKRFDFRKDTLSTPERRTVIQVPAKDQAAAARAAAALAKGESPQAAAKANGVEAVTYPDVARSAIPDPKVAAAAFSLPAGAVSPPIQGQLGWAVVKVVSVTPGQTASIDSVRPELEAELRTEAAQEHVLELAQKYDDAHTGGATLKEAAKAAGSTALELPPVTAQGQSRQATGPLPLLSPKLLAEAFKLPEGGESDLIDEGKGEYFAVRVDKVIPAAVPPLEQERAAITQAYVREAVTKQVNAKIEALAARVRKGESMDAVAASAGVKLDRMTIDLRTAEQDQTQRRQLYGQVFAAKAGAVMTSGPGVLKVEAVKPGPMQPAVIATIAGGQQTRVGMFQDLGDDGARWARTALKVKVDPKRARAALGVREDGKASGQGDSP